ncbi:hypothetical protein MRX96_058714 [Rhipicephalus microplus]
MTQGDEMWPIERRSGGFMPEELQQGKGIKVLNVALNDKGELFDLARFSSAIKVDLATAWVLRFVKNLHSRFKTSGPLTAEKIERTHNLWLKKRSRFIFLSVPVSCCHILASALCRAIVLCLLLLQRCNHISLPFFQFLLPGSRPRSLLHQLLRCQCFNLLACSQPHLVLQWCNHISLPFCQFLLPGRPHRSLLLRQLLRCQCHDLLVYNQPHLVFCSPSLCRSRLLPRKQQGGRS